MKILQQFLIILSFFRFDADHPGMVFYKTRIEEEEQKFLLFKKTAALPREKPPSLPSPGLDFQRRDYLYKNIRQFVPDEFKDVMCPCPNTNKRKETDC